MNRSPHFLLVGSGPYANRGCEAIVRGTMAILRREFGEDLRVTLATYETPQVVAAQAAVEADQLITHVPLLWTPVARWSLQWWRRQATRCVIAEREPYYMLDGASADAACALQVGGDNFSLDYGLPTVKGFMELDDYLDHRGVPIVLWGASVGPFEAEPAFAPEMFAHLRRLRGMMVRETDSYQYLRQHGFDGTLRQMSDPAFVMQPAEPPREKLGCEAPPGAIGLNLAPLMARYVMGHDLDAWVHRSAEIVQRIVAATGRDLLLIPHVTWQKTDDRAFLQRVAAACPGAESGKIRLITGDLSAAELKWVISRCAVFAGARTHSTIAAISSGVPTLSLAYSRKARGLNQDIFGSQEYCVQPAEITPAVIAERIVRLLAENDAIRTRLAEVLPAIRQRAFQAGAMLRQLIENS